MLASQLGAGGVDGALLGLVARAGQGEDAWINLSGEGLVVELLDEVGSGSRSHISLDRDSHVGIILHGLKVDVVLKTRFVPLENVHAEVAHFAYVGAVSDPVVLQDATAMVCRAAVAT